jgi:hypothetical protein
VTTERPALALAPRAKPAFDAYLMVDWSASCAPNTGADSVWWALLEWVDRSARLESGNCETRGALVAHARAVLSDRLGDRRALVGFDFPFGFPRGFAAALWHAGPSPDAWRAVWARLAAEIADGPDNRNNRFAVAAALNAAASGGFGPFYGRPRRVAPEIARTLPARRIGFFRFPLRTSSGPELPARRLADDRARARSSPWFVYGGGNSVGGQALVGIPRVRELRAAISDARIWPFETGARLPPREEARVVLAEIYPSLFHVRDRATEIVHDRLQVEAAARRFAVLDARGDLAALFAAPPADPAVLHEEGWVLGAT